MYYCILILIHILGHSHQTVSSRLHCSDLPLSAAAPEPHWRDPVHQPSRIQTPLVKKSSDSRQHGFSLTLAIPMLLGLDLLALALLPVPNGDPTISCPTTTSPLLCKARQTPGLPPRDLPQQLRVPFADRHPPCAGAVQTENSSQLVTVLQAYFYCPPLLHLPSLSASQFHDYADEANSVRTRNLKYFRVLFKWYSFLLAIWHTAPMHQ